VVVLQLVAEEEALQLAAEAVVLPQADGVVVRPLLSEVEVGPTKIKTNERREEKSIRICGCALCVSMSGLWCVYVRVCDWKVQLCV
jgi:hypothetical protein